VRAVRLAALGAAGLLTVALVAIATVLVAFRVVGYSSAVVMGASMAPAVPIGSLVVLEPAAAEDLHVGDVITYALPDRLITHRVIAIARDDQGVALVTKGDANEAADPGAVRAGGAIGAVRAVVPGAGYLIVALQGWWRTAALAILVAIVVDGVLHRPRARLRVAAA
jgi:signal peptidase I